MLPQINRLPLRFSRNFVESEGKVLHTPYFTLVFAPSLVSTTSHTRIAFIVSKKIHKHAVIRNNLKRKLTACLHAQIKNISPGFDLIFYAKYPLIAVNIQLLESEISKTLQKSKLLLN
jgi:ribonuclease P protein component